MSKQTLEKKSPINLRRKTYNLLNSHTNNDKSAVIVDCFLIMLIIINAFAVIAGTDAKFSAKYNTYLHPLEIFSIIIFTIEYILRCWSCPESPEYEGKKSTISARFRYIFTPMAIVDLLVIAPFYLAFIFNIDLRLLRVLRLLQIFKLSRYSEAMSTLLKVILDEMSSFAAAIFIMLIIMTIAASGIYVIEHDHQPEVFGSIPQSMWWSIVTLTTVGYGDVYPITLLGKIFAAIIMIAGVGLVALPTGILASGFAENIRRGRDKMSEELKDALKDGYINEDEEWKLNHLRRELGLSEEYFTALKESLVKNKSKINEKDVSPVICPHCNKDINIEP